MNDYLTNQDIILELSKRLKDYRLLARMSQKEFAENSGVSQATVAISNRDYSKI
jgi:transcriptional regulator with XRE-family HTH domain